MCQLSIMDQSAGVSNVNKEKIGVVDRAAFYKKPAVVCRKKKAIRKKRALQKKALQSTKRLRPLLRPMGADVPRAPQNSTQFIMDDHEESQDFFNFDTNHQEQQTPSTTNVFAVKDFQKVFQHAHEDSLLNRSTDDLKSEIVSLEGKCANMQQTIAARPSVLLDHLQNLLLNLQEENKKLKQELNQSISDSSSSHTSDSSSDSDSSDSSDSCRSESLNNCSDADCSQCQENRAKEDDKVQPT